MRVSESVAIYVGMNNQGVEKGEKSIFAESLNLNANPLNDKIAQRRKQAQEQAMKVVIDVWEGDKALDEDLERRRVRIGELRKEMQNTQKQMDDITEMQKQLLEEEGFTTDSQEWKDLQEQKKGLSENYDEFFKEMKIEIATISATKLERLKKEPMVKAQKQAEEIMTAASEDVLGMLVEEGMKHIDEEKEERQEEGEKIEEEKEQQEAFIEAQKEKRQEQEKLLEQMPVEEMLILEQVKTDVGKEVQNIMDRMKLIAEDIKGAVVDEAL